MASGWRLAAGLAWRRTRWALGDRSPYVATLKVTGRCNLDCAHCPWTVPGSAELDTNRWGAIISRLTERGVRHLVLEGGEPTERADLAELIAAGRGSGAKVTVATNATRDLSQFAPDRFLVSIDGPPAVHDELRGSGVAARIRAVLPTASAPKVALVNIGAHNRDYLGETLQYWAPLVDGFWLSFVYDFEGQASLALSPFERREVGREALGLAGDYRVFNTREFFFGRGTGESLSAWLLVSVSADGREHGGCTITLLESPSCERCDLACHRELSGLLSIVSLADQVRTHRRKPWLR